jgi:hypothetical protein
MLQGIVPAALAAALPRLEVLDLSHNLLSGRIPASGTHFTCFIGTKVQMTHPRPPLWQHPCLRYSLYLLYWYKDTNDAPSTSSLAASPPQVLRMLTYADVC